MYEDTLVIYTIWGSHSGGYEDLYLLGWAMCQAWNLHEAGSKQSLTFNGLYGIISQ
jgi:hypothetical protein